MRGRLVEASTGGEEDATVARASWAFVGTRHLAQFKRLSMTQICNYCSFPFGQDVLPFAD